MNSPLLINADAPAVDVQAREDHRGITIDRVGIRGLRYPIRLAIADEEQVSVAEWELAAELQAERRGTHMSRFVEILEASSREPMNPARLLAMLAELRGRLETPTVSAHCATTMFLNRSAPVSGRSAKHAVNCIFDASLGRQQAELRLGVRAPVTTLCPCSKEISEYGAHNQRGYVQISAQVRPDADMSFLDLLAIAEASGSAVIYPLLKRADERYVTMRAYDSPTFVEDVVRSAALGLRADERILAFTVEAENQESIHDHAAVAAVTWQRQ